MADLIERQEVKNLCESVHSSIQGYLRSGAENLNVKQDDNTFRLHVVTLALVDLQDRIFGQDFVRNEVIELSRQHGVAVRVHAVVEEEAIPLRLRTSNFLGTQVLKME